MKHEEEMLLERLGVGKENAKKAKEIGFSPRTLRKLVEGLRRDFYPICSSNSGYYLAKNEEELFETINRLEAGGNSTLDSAFNLRRCLDEQHCFNWETC